MFDHKKYYQRNRERIIERQKRWNKKNREKVNKYQSDYYWKDKKKVMSKRKKQRNKRRDILKERALKLLGGKCTKCGYDKCVQALEFHHVKGKKDFSVSNLIRTFSNWERIKRELKKCILLCANCHREEHFLKVDN